MANGNSTAARSARAKLQLRDSKGRWIEMGRSRVTWYSSKAGKNLAGTAMEVTPDGKNAVVSVSNNDGSSTNHVVAGKSLTIVESKVTLPSTGKEPTNPKFYQKQAKNIAALELPKGSDEKTQAAFDNAYDTVKIQDKISPGINKTISDGDGNDVSYGDLVETKKGPAFVVGLIPATNSSVLAFSDGSVKITKGHLITVKDKGDIVPEKSDDQSDTQSDAQTVKETPLEGKMKAWEINDDHLNNSPIGTTISTVDDTTIVQKTDQGWEDAKGSPVENDIVLDILMDFLDVKVSQKEGNKDPESEDTNEEADVPSSEDTQDPITEDTEQTDTDSNKESEPEEIDWVDFLMQAVEDDEPTPEPTPNPGITSGKITAKTFTNQTGSDENGKYFTDAEGNKIYEGEKVDYNKSKGTVYTASVVKVNKNNVILHVPDLDKNITSQQHKVFKKKGLEQKEENKGTENDKPDSSALEENKGAEGQKPDSPAPSQNDAQEEGSKDNNTTSFVDGEIVDKEDVKGNYAKFKSAPVDTKVIPASDKYYGYVKDSSGAWRLDVIDAALTDSEMAEEMQYLGTDFHVELPEGSNSSAPIPNTNTDLYNKEVVDAKNWTKVSGPQGSNEGGVYEDEEGDQYYVKLPETEAHAKNEVLADKLYQALGIDTAKLELTDVGGPHLGTSSKMLDGSQKNLESAINNPGYKAKVQEGFAVDAWLANWDVAGTGFDNIVTDSSGNPVRVDPGGSLAFRAMGSPKGAAFSDTVSELDTLRDGSNHYSTALFGDMTDSQIVDSINKVEAISPDTINALVDSMDFDPETANMYKDKLLKRRENLIERKKDFQQPQKTDSSFSGADETWYNENKEGIAQTNPVGPTTPFEFTGVVDLEDHPLYGAPQPKEPTPVPAFNYDTSTPIIDWEGKDEWLSEAEERFNNNPFKNALDLQSSANWAKIQSVLNGDTTHLDYLTEKKYITDSMNLNAKESIQKAKDAMSSDDAIKKYEEDKKEHEKKVNKYNDDLKKYLDDMAEWNLVNGENSIKPVPSSIEFPSISNEALWEKTSDWSKSDIGTFSAQNVFDTVKSNNQTASHGLSIAVDSGHIENHEVRVTRFVGTDGEEKMRMSFKVTHDQGNWMEENAVAEYDQQYGLGYRKLAFSKKSGLYVDTGFSTYEEGGGRKYVNTTEDGSIVSFFRADSKENADLHGDPDAKVLRKQSTYQNQVDIVMPKDATPQDFAKHLESLGIKANPTTQGDSRVLAENKLMKMFGEYSTNDKDKTAIDPTKNFQGSDREKQLKYIKDTYELTVDDVESVTDDTGHTRLMLSDDAAARLADIYMIDNFHHGFTYSNPTVDAVYNILTGDVAGLRATSDRGSSGISSIGQSSNTDHKQGSGDYVYTTPNSKAPGIKVDPVKMLKSLDLWVNEKDDWGLRRLDRANTPHTILSNMSNKQGVHEVMVPKTIPVTWWSNVTVNSQADKAALIKKLTASGVKAVNGKSLSDFIKIMS